MERFEDYQVWQETAAYYPKKHNFEGLEYATLAMVGEAGEVANELKKVIRDYRGIIVPEIRHKLLLELGDVLWYISAITNELGSSLDEISDLNKEKITARAYGNMPVG